jgi:excisionase family DNA binding protein
VSSTKNLFEMTQDNLILDKLTEIANKLDEQNLLQKTVLNFNEACKYLDVSPSHLYKLTSTKQIPHFCPQGKKLYFKREELDNWLQRNRQSASDEIEQVASDYVLRNRRKK